MRSIKHGCKISLKLIFYNHVLSLFLIKSRARQFIFNPDFSRLTWQCLLIALGGMPASWVISSDLLRWVTVNILSILSNHVKILAGFIKN